MTDLPSVLTKEAAAFELSISVKTLSRMIKAGLVSTVPINKREMVPASEIRRLASVQVTAQRKAALAKRPDTSFAADAELMEANRKARRKQLRA